MQLDIFEHGHEVMLRNDIVAWVLVCETVAGCARCQRVMPLQRVDDVVAQHHIVTVLEDIELHRQVETY